MRSSRPGSTARSTGAVAALLAAALATSSCAADPDTEAARPVSATPAASAGQPAGSSNPAGPVPVPDTLRFTGKTLDGTGFDAASLAGRPVVLWFWAPWCATCASQAWTVAELAPQFQDKVPIIGVAGLGAHKAMTEFVTEFELGSVPTLDDSAGAVWRRFEVVEQSTFVVIDRDGRILHQGFLDGEELTRRVTALAG